METKESATVVIRSNEMYERFTKSYPQSAVENLRKKFDSILQKLKDDYPETIDIFQKFLQCNKKTIHQFYKNEPIWNCLKYFDYWVLDGNQQICLMRLAFECDAPLDTVLIHALFLDDKVSDNSEYVLLDAKDIAAKAVARIKLPRRVPHGLHGSWMMF